MHLELWQWALGTLGAFRVGLSKTSIPGLGILSIAIFALVFPARESVGLVLVILICGDIVGALVGRPIVERLNQRLFELIALALTFVAALGMIR